MECQFHDFSFIVIFIQETKEKKWMGIIKMGAEKIKKNYSTKSTSLFLFMLKTFKNTIYIVAGYVLFFFLSNSFITKCILPSKGNENYKEFNGRDNTKIYGVNGESRLSISISSPQQNEWQCIQNINSAKHTDSVQWTILNFSFVLCSIASK